MAEIGLLFGSFDPIHNGHLAMAQAALGMDWSAVWLIVHQKNLYKAQERLEPATDRISMVNLAVENKARIKVRQTSKDMLGTLRLLAIDHPGNEFHLLMGLDLASSLPQWPDGRELVANYQIYTYPRLTYPGTKRFGHPNVHLLPAEHVDISSGMVKRKVAQGQPINDLVPAGVAEYIKAHGLYGA